VETGSAAEELAGPVLIELCRLLESRLDELDRVSDVDLYSEVVFAASLQHSRENFVPRPAPDLARAASLILPRLRSGWFANTVPASPQAHHCTTTTVAEVSLHDGDASCVFAEKPLGALWTSSYLPDGTSAWHWGERAEFGSDRAILPVAFDESRTRIFTVDQPADYSELIHRYPRPLDDGRALVMWTEVARDFDAVHLSTHGLVTTHHVGFTTRHGHAVLRGWDAECTAWLHQPPA
jgi:hypothetical protein